MITYMFVLDFFLAILFAENTLSVTTFMLLSKIVSVMFVSLLSCEAVCVWCYSDQLISVCSLSVLQLMAAGKWLILEKTTYVDRAGKTRY